MNGRSYCLAVGLGLLTLVPLAGAAQGQTLSVSVDAPETAPGIQEVGADFRISQMGVARDIDRDALTPAVAYNPEADEFLVVWAGDHTTDGAVEVYAQRIRASDGQALGEAVRVSSMGARDDDPAFDARTPAVTYHPQRDEYLVVWVGDDAVDGLHHLFGQRLDAAGQAIGPDDALLAEGPAASPALAYDATRHHYLVVWQGEDPAHPQASEIYAQRLHAEATPLESAIRVSDMGAADDNPAFDALAPAVVYNPAADAFLVVWAGDDDTDGLGDGAFEIFAQQLDAKTGREIGPNDRQVSDMGRAANDPAFIAHHPAVAFNPVRNEYLIVWSGDDEAAYLADGEIEIFGQRLDGYTGKEVGVNDVRISAMGVARDTRFAAAHPAVTVTGDTYLVVWRGDHHADAMVEGAQEIFGRYLPGDRAASDPDDAFLRLSDMGMADEDPTFDALQPALAAGASGRFLLVWSGDDDADAVDNEHEIYGQLGDAGSGAGAASNAVEVPGEFLLSAYPNPFNPRMTLSVAIKEPQHISIDVYDVLGRRVASLFQGPVEALRLQSYVFDASSLPSGPYFIRIVGETFLETKNVTLLK